MKESKPCWAVLPHFTAHIFMAALMFALIASVSVLLSLAMHWLEAKGVPEFTLLVLVFVERAILVIDACAFLLFLGTTAFDWVKEARK